MKTGLHAIVLLFCFTAILTSCGRKSRPVPPQAVLPARITDLGYDLTGKGVTLTWSWPRISETGKKLPNITTFLLQKAAVPAARACPGCPPPFDRAREIQVQPLPNAEEPTAARYTDTDLRAGYHYTYRIISKGAWYQVSGPSNPVSFTWQTPPAAPQNIKASAFDGRITLSWQAVKTYANGEPIDRQPLYQIYRSTNRDNLHPYDEPVNGNSYDDLSVSNYTTYYYRIRALLPGGEETFTSFPSETVSARPLDLTPPPSPPIDSLVKTEKGIRLYWEAVQAEDLKGYRIYRLRGENEKAELIGEVPAPTTVFFDTAPPTDAGTWYYAVTSFDNADPPNESQYTRKIQYKRIN